MLLATDEAEKIYFLSVIFGMTKSISDRLTTDMGEIEQRRAHVRERYAQLRVDHPALPPVLRDFQVQGANNSIIDCWKGSYWMLFLSL